jgi:hypothetical protein
LKLEKASRMLKDAASIDYEFLCKEKEHINFVSSHELKKVIKIIDKKKYNRKSLRKAFS